MFHIVEKYALHFFAAFCILFISISVGLKVLFFKKDVGEIHLPRIYLKSQSSLIWYFIIIFALTFSILAVLKFNAYNMGIFDLGRINQVIWNTAHGRFFINTFELGNVNRLFVHCEFIYLLIAPLYCIFPDPRMLLILQTVVISLGVLPIYWLTKDKLKSNFAGLCFAMGYFLFPSLQYGNLADFHPDMLAMTFLLFTLYYLEKKTWNRFLVFMFLSLLCKEYVSLIVIMLGGYIIFNHKNIKIGISCLLLGVGWFILTCVYIPAQEQWLLGDLDAVSRELLKREHLFFKTLGNSTIEVAKNVVLHPIATIKYSFVIDVLPNFGLLFLPLGFISLFYFKILILCLPALIGIALHHYYTYASHHYGIIIPFIFVSAIGAAGYLVDKAKRNLQLNKGILGNKSIHIKNIAWAVGIFIFSNSLFSSILYGFSPVSLRFWNKSSYLYWGSVNQFKKTKHDQIADKFIKMVPDAVPISVSNHLGAHLSQREIIHYFPYPENFDNIEYILIDLLEYIPSSFHTPRKREISKLKHLMRNEQFGIAASQDGFLLFKKGLTKEKIYHTNIKVISGCHPEYQINASFGRRIKLIGFDYRSDRTLKADSRQRITYYWQVLEEFDRPFMHSYFGVKDNLDKNYIIIDTLSNKDEEFRIVHLPAYILYPPNEWKKGDIIKEEFDFYIPGTLSEGNYIWQSGLYIVPNYIFISTEEKDLVPHTERIGLGTAKLTK